MKKLSIILLFIVLLVLSSTISYSEWDTKQNDLGRTGIVTGVDTISEVAYFINYNFTCGTGDGNSDIQPIILDVDNDGYNEMFVYCSGDATNGNGHLMIIDSNLEIIDSITVTGEWSVNALYYFQFDVTNIDDDDNYEVVIYTPNDITAAKKLEVIIYEFNTSNEEFIKEYNYPFVNYTHSWNDTVNITDFDDFTTDIHIECKDSLCIILHDEHVFSLNVSSQTKEWYVKLSDINSGFDGNHFISSGSPSYHYYPTWINIDLTGNEEYCVLDINDFLCIDVNEGDITHNYTLDVTGSAGGNYQILSCSASRCENDRMMIIVATDSSVSDKYICEIFDSQDGDKKQITEVYISGLSPDATYCWIEDRDNDSNDELCVAGFDHGILDNGRVLCEELNLFETNTLKEELHWNITTSSQDDNINNQMVIADYNQDGYYDIIMDSAIWNFNNIIDSINYPEITFLNDSVGTTNYFSTIVSQYVIPNRLDIISIPNMDNFDSYYVTIFSDAEDIDELINTKIDFTTQGPIKQISNPICQNELLEWECSYANGCVEDEENDEIALCVDCFDDGSHVVCTEPVGFFTFSESLECDLSLTALTGYVNVSFTVWDDNGGFGGANQSRNNTYDTNYYIASENQSCYNTTNPGDILDPVVNTIPEILSSPSGNAPSPYCLNSVITFECLNHECYTDDDDDEVYLSVDCEGDGTYIGYGIGDTDFSCYFNVAGSRQVSMQVCDLFHTNCASISWSVEISERTIYDVLDDGIMDCGSPYLLDAEGEFTGGSSATKPFFTNSPKLSFITDKPFCLNDLIDIECVFGLCYSVSDPIIETSIEIDCQGDGNVDTITSFRSNHSFKCSYQTADLSYAVYDNDTDTYTFTVLYTIRNELGQSDNTTSEITVSTNTSVCLSSAEIDIINVDEIDEYNALKKFFYSLGEDTNLGGYLCAMIFMFLMSVVLGVIVAISSTVILGAIIGGVSLILLVIIFTIAEVISWLTIIIFILAFAAYIAYKVTG